MAINLELIQTSRQQWKGLFEMTMVPLELNDTLGDGALKKKKSTTEDVWCVERCRSTGRSSLCSIVSVFCLTVAEKTSKKLSNVE